MKYHAQLSLFIVLVVLYTSYILLAVWIIPTYVPAEDRAKASTYSSYGIAMVSTLYFATDKILDIIY